MTRRGWLKSKWMRNVTLGLLLVDGLGIYAAQQRLTQPVFTPDTPSQAAPLAVAMASPVTSVPRAVSAPVASAPVAAVPAPVVTARAEAAPKGDTLAKAPVVTAALAAIDPPAPRIVPVVTSTFHAHTALARLAGAHSAAHSASSFSVAFGGGFDSGADGAAADTLSAPPPVSVVDGQVAASDDAAKAPQASGADSVAPPPANDPAAATAPQASASDAPAPMELPPVKFGLQ